jgi:threonine dehydrogenase-like Zn-dependent dehydrogenase
VEDGYATEVVAPGTALVPLSPACDLLDASLAEPLACVLGAVEMLDLSRLDRVVVVGAGFMGLLTVDCLTAIGHEVVVIEPRPVAREKASELGAAWVLAPGEVDVAALTSEMVIEATGTSGGLQTASDLVATNGTLGILGYHQSGNGRRTVDMREWNFRALKVLNLQHREQSDLLRWINRALRMMARGVIRPSGFVDCFLSIDELPRAFGDDPPAYDFKAVLRTTAEAG